MTFEEAHSVDRFITMEYPHWFMELPPLAPCRCGGTPNIDISMGLIHCDTCGLSFEYRYDRGVVPYYTYQKSAGVEV